MKFWRRERPSPFDEPIKRVLNDMALYGPTADEYSGLVAELTRLTEAKSAEARKWKVSPDTLAIVLGNIAVVLVIVGYEHSHVMTSKASTYVLRSKEPKI